MTYIMQATRDRGVGVSGPIGTRRRVGTGARAIAAAGSSATGLGVALDLKPTSSFTDSDIARC